MQVSTHIWGGPTTLPAEPPHLLLPIWGLQLLTHHVVVSGLAQALHSNPCSGICSTAQTLVTAVFKAKPENGAGKVSTSLMTGESPESLIG